MNCIIVTSVSCSAAHSVSKTVRPAIQLLTGLGVEHDAHLGVTVQHRSRVARDPSQPNLRQVQLIHAELYDELSAVGFVLSPGVMGENITTRGVDLLALPTSARLAIGPSAIVELTGLRNPCGQLDGIQAGLMAATLARDTEGKLVPNPGAYVSESNYFEKDFQHSTGGATTLASQKSSKNTIRVGFSSFTTVSARKSGAPKAS